MAWHTGQTCEEYDSGFEKTLAEARRQEALQERKEAKEKEAGRQQEIAAEAARQEARKQAARREAAKQKVAREKALANAKALRHKHAMDNQASHATIKRIAKTCPNKQCGAQIQKINGCDHMMCRYLTPLQIFR